MFLNTNIAAMSAQRHVYQTNLDLDKSIERLSSGLRINTAADDASGLAIAEKMYAQRAGLTTAIQNTQDSSALFKIAEGALNQVGKMLGRIEELAVRAANKTLTSSDRASISNEINELMSQIDSISENTEYNTLKLLNQNLDVKKSLNVAGATIAGSMKILDAGATVKDSTNLTLSVISAATAAISSGTNVAVTGSLGINSIININGIDISVISTDTVDTVVSKINSLNSRTGVVAVTDQTGLMALITGKLDADAANVIDAINGSSVVNGSAIAYQTVGTAQTITIAGSNSVWVSLGFDSGNLADYFASGTNANATLSGVSFSVDGDDGSVLEMKNSGSSAYGLKVGTDMFNGAYGAMIYTRKATMTENYSTHATVEADEAAVTLDTSNMLRLHVGANYDQALKYNIGATDTRSLGIGASSKFGSLAEVTVDTAENANIALKVVQQAIKDVAAKRSSMGAVLNRLDYTDKTLQVQRENMAAAESKIRDADISLEMTIFTKQQILMQAGTSMLAQANSKPQSILQLLK